jgi:hypothetical protein
MAEAHPILAGSSRARYVARPPTLAAGSRRSAASRSALAAASRGSIDRDVVGGGMALPGTTRATPPHHVVASAIAPTVQ